MLGHRRNPAVETLLLRQLGKLLRSQIKGKSPPLGTGPVGRIEVIVCGRAWGISRWPFTYPKVADTSFWGIANHRSCLHKAGATTYASTLPIPAIIIAEHFTEGRKTPELPIRVVFSWPPCVAEKLCYSSHVNLHD
jgi:hypothetical protein